MNAVAAREALSKRPFRPFNLHYPSGQVYGVRSPDQAVLTADGRTMIVPKVTAEGRGGADFLDVILAERIEFLDVEASEPLWWVDLTDGNGPRPEAAGGA